MANKSKLIKDVYYNMNKGKCESAEFIRAVRNNPALYDPENSDYKAATVKEAIWKELASQFGVTCDVAKKRWKSLRDTYTKKFRISEEHALNFKYGKELLFLKPYMKAERSHSMINVTKNLNSKTIQECELDSPMSEYKFGDIVFELNEKDLLQELDIKVFLCQVRDHVSIWNQNFHSYNISEERNKAWWNIGKNLIEHFEHLSQENQNKIIKILRRKYQKLREKYLTTKRSLASKPGCDPEKIFVYYSDMAFLENGFKLKRESTYDDEFRETDSNIGLNMKAEYLSDSLVCENFEDDSTVEFVEYNPHSSLDKHLSDTNLAEEEDEDRLFLLSLVKEMKKIPKDHKLDARLNILVVLRNWQKMHYVSDSSFDEFKDNEN